MDILLDDNDTQTQSTVDTDSRVILPHIPWYTPLISPRLVTVPCTYSAPQKSQNISDGANEISDMLRQFYVDINKEI